MFLYFKKNYEDILYNYYEWNDYNTDMKRLFDEESLEQSNPGKVEPFGDENREIQNEPCAE